MSNQGTRQGSARTIHGEAGRTHSSDFRRMFGEEVVVPAGMSWNGALLLWINDRLSTAYTNVNSAKVAFARSLGLDRWADITTIVAEGGGGSGTGDFTDDGDWNAADWSIS